MSRFVHLTTALTDRSELLAGLTDLGLHPELADLPAGLMLRGSLECAGEPVDLRLPAGALGSVEDFGLTRRPDGAFDLVCSEHDRALLERALLTPLRQAIAGQRARAAAAAADLDVEETRGVDGDLRLILRRRP